MDKSGEIVEFQSVGRDVTEIYQSKQQIEAQNDTLLQQAEKLTNLNTTLQYLLEQAETNRLQYEQNIKKQVALMVTPILNKLASNCTTELQKQYINLLMTNLNQLTAKEKAGLDLSLAMLTQREIEIALLIKDGKSSQEIADLLFLSENTVKTHRKNLRTKLKCKKHNLQTYLRMIMKY
jgi:DNA-binding CsgD family transcriptional regulator